MRNLIGGVLLAAGVTTTATAAVVNPNLPVGVSLNSFELASSGQWQQVSLAQNERPAALTLTGDLALAQLHLGTGTDVFGVYHTTVANSLLAPESYWLRYTLDPSSYSVGTAYPDQPVFASSGDLWISFTPQSGGYEISPYLEKVSNAQSYPGSSNTHWLSPGQTGIQSIGFSNPGNCTPGDCGIAGINLSFLQLAWNPNTSRYDLATSAVGFDQVFYAYDWRGTLEAKFYIAPVPLPASAVLLLSGLTGLVGARRLRKSVI